MKGQGEYRESIWSLCPECLKTIPGVVRDTSYGVVMEKACPDHGEFQALVSSDLDTYERIRRTPRRVTTPANYATEIQHGCPDDCGLCPDHDQHTCLAILDITSRCDLGCPVCLASSHPRGRDLELPVIRSALEKLIQSEGKPTPLQLSGGEPMLHGELEDVIKTAAALGFEKIEIDTNGLALGRDPSLAERLQEAGLAQVYLQMDGLEPRISEFIRGKDIIEEKLRAIENCKRSGLQVALSVTVVPGVNDDCLWDMIKFGVEHRLTGVNFQAVALSGRFPKSLTTSPERLTLGHFMHKVEEQSGGKLLATDLTPIPCPDPRCGALTYALIVKGELVPLSRIVDDGKLVAHLADMSDWETVIEQVDLASSNGSEECSVSCGCSAPPVSMDRLFFSSDPFFSIGYHGMMDPYCFDRERVRRCCVHELTADGKLIPLCLYNMKYRPGERAVGVRSAQGHRGT